MSKTFKAGPHSFEFETHGHNGYNHHVSINIKAYVYGEKVSDEHKKKLEQLEALETGMTRQIEEWAWEAMSDSFWEWAIAEAAARGLGKIFSEGRQGGHLVLFDYPPSRIDDLCAAYESECELCHRGWDEHANGQCLFQSTTWKALNYGCLEELQLIKKFEEDIQALKLEWPKEYAYQLEYYIDDRWDTRPTEEELAATARVRSWKAGAAA